MKTSIHCVHVQRHMHIVEGFYHFDFCGLCVGSICCSGVERILSPMSTWLLCGHHQASMCNFCSGGQASRSSDVLCMDAACRNVASQHATVSAKAHHLLCEMYTCLANCFFQCAGWLWSGFLHCCNHVLGSWGHNDSYRCVLVLILWV